MLAEKVLSKLEAMFGQRIFDEICEKIIKEYFGDEMDVRTAMAQRPDLVERAFHSIFGNAGVAILWHICNELCIEFRLDLSCSGKGDLVKFIELGPQRVMSNLQPTSG